MDLINGTVQMIEDGTVRTGHFQGKAYKTITLTTNNKLTAFEVENVKDVVVGKEYTFPTEKSGNYTNIIGDVILAVDVNADIKEASKPAEEVLPKVHSAMEERAFKNRISALASAVEFLVDSGGDKFSIGNVPQTAEEFLKFINGEV